MVLKDWETKFDKLMHHDLIEIPANFYNEDLYFTDPSDLSAIFTELEEKNLFMIHMRQEVEQT